MAGTLTPAWPGSPRKQLHHCRAAKAGVGTRTRTPALPRKHIPLPHSHTLQGVPGHLRGALRNADADKARANLRANITAFRGWKLLFRCRSRPRRRALRTCHRRYFRRAPGSMRLSEPYGPLPSEVTSYVQLPIQRNGCAPGADGGAGTSASQGAQAPHLPRAPARRAKDVAAWWSSGSKLAAALTAKRLRCSDDSIALTPGTEPRGRG